MKSKILDINNLILLGVDLGSHNETEVTEMFDEILA